MLIQEATNDEQQQSTNPTNQPTNAPTIPTNQAGGQASLTTAKAYWRRLTVFLKSVS